MYVRLCVFIRVLNACVCLSELVYVRYTFLILDVITQRRLSDVYNSLIMPIKSL